MNGLMRLMIASTIIIAIANIIINIYVLLKAYPKIVLPILIVFVIGIYWINSNSKPVKSSALRTVYINQLKSYVGTQYYWGGETRLGIDCSGLARTAFWQTMLAEGISKHNFHLLVPILWKFWWRDLSASDMEDGKYNYTKHIGKADKLAGYNNKNLSPGDIAIPGSSHVLIYIGNNQWIEASPEDNKVVINKAIPNSKRSYFNMKVEFVRWWILE